MYALWPVGVAPVPALALAPAHPAREDLIAPEDQRAESMERRDRELHGIAVPASVQNGIQPETT